MVASIHIDRCYAPVGWFEERQASGASDPPSCAFYVSKVRELWVAWFQISNERCRDGGYVKNSGFMVEGGPLHIAATLRARQLDCSLRTVGVLASY